MIQWLQAVTVSDVITALVAFGAIVGGLKWLRPLLSGVRHFLEDWQGVEDRPGVPGRPGIVAQIGVLRCDLEGVRADMQQIKADSASAAFHSKPNHGSSSHDSLMREVRDSRAEVRKLSGQMTAILREQESARHAIEQSVADRAEIREHVGLDPHEPEEPKQEDE